jgi:hypothetical protein
LHDFFWGRCPSFGFFGIFHCFAVFAILRSGPKLDSRGSPGFHGDPPGFHGDPPRISRGPTRIPRGPHRDPPGPTGDPPWTPRDPQDLIRIRSNFRSKSRSEFQNRPKSPKSDQIPKWIPNPAKIGLITHGFMAQNPQNQEIQSKIRPLLTTHIRTPKSARKSAKLLKTVFFIYTYRLQDR